MATLTIDLIRGVEFLFNKDFCGSGSTSGSTTWTELTDKPQWLSATTLNEFQTGHTHSQYLSSVTNLGTGITIGSKSGNTINLNTLKGSGNTTIQKIGNEIIIATVDIIEIVSRTIYVETTGSDITGDGSIGLPYATIHKALLDIGDDIRADISLQFGLGVFDYTMADRYLLDEKKVSDGHQLLIVGTWKDELTGFTLVADGTNPFLYNMAGQTMVADAYDYGFLLRSGTYYPLTNNTTTQIETFQKLSSGTHLYNLGTVFNNTDNSYYWLNTFALCDEESGIEFQKISFTSTLNTNLEHNNFTKFRYCKFNDRLDIEENVKLSFQFCHLEEVFSDANNCIYQQCNFNFSGFYNLQMKSGYHIIRGGLFNGASTAAIRLVDAQALNNNTSANSNRGLYFKDTPTAFSIDNGRFDGKAQNETYLNNVNYLIASDSYTVLSLSVLGLLNSPVISLREDGSNELMNLYNQVNIVIPNTYPEYDILPETVLTDNATGTTQIGDTTQNKSIFIKYSITRNTSREEGTIWIDNKSDTNISIKSEFDDCGVTFEKEILGTEINLIWTTTSTGNAAIFNYMVERIMV